MKFQQLNKWMVEVDAVPWSTYRREVQDSRLHLPESLTSELMVGTVKTVGPIDEKLDPFHSYDIKTGDKLLFGAIDRNGAPACVPMEGQPLLSKGHYLVMKHVVLALLEE